MAEVRKAAGSLKLIVGDNYWPLGCAAPRTDCTDRLSEVFMIVNFPSVLRVGAATLSFLAVSACGSTPVEVREPDFIGTATRVDQRGDDVEVWMNAFPQSTAGAGERIIHVERGTTLSMRERDGTAREVTGRDIVVGSILRVKATGVELRTLPPQYYATWVEIIPPLPE